MNAQSSLFDTFPVAAEPTDHVGPRDGLTIEQAFTAFHAENPHVYTELVAHARELHCAGHSRLSIGMLFEVLRFTTLLRTHGDEFKLNNNYRSYYARQIMLREPDLRDAFETRQLHTIDGRHAPIRGAA